MALERDLIEGVPILLAQFRVGEVGLHWLWGTTGRYAEPGGKVVEAQYRYLRIYNRGKTPMFLAPVTTLLGTSLGVTVAGDQIVMMEIRDGLTVYAMSSSRDGNVYANVGFDGWDNATLVRFGTEAENIPAPPNKYVRKPLEES